MTRASGRNISESCFPLSWSLENPLVPTISYYFLYVFLSLITNLFTIKEKISTPAFHSIVPRKEAGTCARLEVDYWGDNARPPSTQVHTNQNSVHCVKGCHGNNGTEFHYM